jgi:hypothetical protein
MPEEELLAGYARLLGALYDADAYYARCADYVDRVPPRVARKRVGPRQIAILFRAAWHLGLRSPRRWHFWRLLGRALRRPHTFAWAVAHALQGEHMIRYASEGVLPRIAEALAEVRAARDAAPHPAPAPPVALTATARCG